MSCLTLSPKKRKKVTSYPKKKKNTMNVDNHFLGLKMLTILLYLLLKKNFQAEIIINAINNTLKI